MWAVGDKGGFEDDRVWEREEWGIHEANAWNGLLGKIVVAEFLVIPPAPKFLVEGCFCMFLWVYSPLPLLYCPSMYIIRDALLIGVLQRNLTSLFHHSCEVLSIGLQVICIIAQVPSQMPTVSQKYIL